MSTLRKWLFALTMVAPAAGQASAQGLLSNRSIHDELKVTPEQAAKLDALAREFQAESRDRARKLAGLPIEERRKAIEERRKTAQETFRRTWEDQLTKLSATLSPAQVKRFEQISVQNAGLLAFQMSPFRDRLKLTGEQAAKIQEIQDDLARLGGPQAAIQKRFQDDPAGAQRRLEEDSKAAVAKAVALLTDEQKQTWADLTGPPFRLKREPIPAP